MATRRTLILTLLAAVGVGVMIYVFWPADSARSSTAKQLICVRQFVSLLIGDKIHEAWASATPAFRQTIAEPDLREFVERLHLTSTTSTEAGAVQKLTRKGSDYVAYEILVTCTLKSGETVILRLIGPDQGEPRVDGLCEVRYTSRGMEFHTPLRSKS